MRTHNDPLDGLANARDGYRRKLGRDGTRRLRHFTRDGLASFGQVHRHVQDRFCTRPEQHWTFTHERKPSLRKARAQKTWAGARPPLRLGDPLLVLLPLLVQVVEHGLRLLESASEAFFGNGIVGAELEAVVVEEGPDLLIVDEEGDFLSRVGGPAQKGPAAVEPTDQGRAKRAFERRQLLGEAAKLLRKALAEGRRAFATFVHDVLGSEAKHDGALAVAQIRLYVPLARRDDV